MVALIQWISRLIQQYIHDVGGEDLEGLIGMLGGVLLIGCVIFYTARAIGKKIKGRRNKAVKFHLSKEDFLQGKFRLGEGISAGKTPITLKAPDLVTIHSEVVGKIIEEEALIESSIKKKVARFVYPGRIPSNYVHFAGIERKGKIFVMRKDSASKLKDIERQIKELNSKDYFTNKIFK